MAYRGFLAPGAKSKIGAPFPDFFQKKIQNGRPKTNSGHFQERKGKKMKSIRFNTSVNKNFISYM